jgi:hypothetical protein
MLLAHCDDNHVYGNGERFWMIDDDDNEEKEKEGMHRR